MNERTRELLKALQEEPKNNDMIGENSGGKHGKNQGH